MIPEARFVLSKKRLFEQYKKLEDLGLTVSYSVKTNPVVAGILEKATDCLFSIHREEELGFVKDKSRVWFLAESWDMKTIRRLVRAGVKNFVVYNAEDLKVLEHFIEKTKTRINLLLRARLRENTIFTERYFVFGMASGDINSFIKRLRKNRNIEKLGVHFHRKTQNVSEWELKYEVKNMLEKETLAMIDILNIGGGLPVKYRNTGDDSLPFIFRKIKELRDFLRSYGTDMMIEPGRFLAGPSIKLEAFVQSVNGNTITVNCSVYNSAMDSLIVPVRLLVEGELPENRGKKYLIKGFTPCSLDIFRYAVNLKKKKPGDRIVFLNAGAYNFHTDFCSLGKIKTEIAE